MKEIKYQEETIVYKTKYEAIDGTIFFNKEQCEKYDDIAEAVLRSKYNKLIVEKTDEYSMIGFGSGDNIVDMLRLNGKDDADVAKQMMFFVNPHYKEHIEDKKYDWLEKYFNTIDEVSRSNEILFVGRGYGEEDFWIIGTAKSLCEKINGFNKTNETKSEPEYGGC